MGTFDNLNKSELPREKVLSGRLKELTDAEIMALIFGTGTKERNVLELCSDILLDHDGHLSKVMDMDARTLMSTYKGIGPAKAINLLAALELGARAVADKKKRELEGAPVTSSDVACDIMRHHFQGLQHEEFWVLMLSRSGRVVGDTCISKGGTAATTVDVKIIMKNALLRGASSLLLFHNHPSGTLRPSVEDDNLTKKIATAAKYFDISVHDHIIVTDTGYYSYADVGRI